jgi:dolichyl-phosphate-mannose--protein O-mannosyl transferase
MKSLIYLEEGIMVSIALYQIFGKPFIVYLGVVTIISFIVTAIFALSFYRLIKPKGLIYKLKKPLK